VVTGAPHACRHGFWGIFLLAAWPNALFDLCGICCGHFLMPFWQFFGATLAGKAVVKARPGRGLGPQHGGLRPAALGTAMRVSTFVLSASKVRAGPLLSRMPRGGAGELRARGAA